MAGFMKGRKEQKDAGEERVPDREGKILVRICGKENGLEEYDGVNFIRIISKKYNLLIMADYLPIIGKIEGSVFFRTKDAEYQREQLSGYFMHKNNEFSLMLEHEGTEEEA